MPGRIEWVQENCRLLQEIAGEFRETRPFSGLTIGTAIHLEPKTVALLMTLRDGGADIVATGNLNSTQPDTLAWLSEKGIRVIGEATQDPGRHRQFLQQVLAAKPDMLLDNGGDLFELFLEQPYDSLLGGTEETTSGRMRLALRRAELNRPILVINDSPIKQFAENEHAVGQSVLESYMRVTNRITNGQRVTVFGYGACGMGVAYNFRNANAKVSVVDSDPLKRLRAHLDGFDTPDRETAIRSADVIITVTGGGRVLGSEDLALLKDNVILANAGHFPTEIDVADIAAHGDIRDTVRFAEGITCYTVANGRRIRILTDGHMLNLAGPRPLGNSIESMDLGFALQSRCLEAVARGYATRADCVVPVPREIDERVANGYLSLHYPAGH
ncbi:adenosylhomocysteinase [Raoultella terrigena]|uniref:adenosylhomocysteinase n=1 Tax=Raoultella terrigena TaxID=577 RepID=UPI001F52AA95|nr:adenosylhomocysteinase [Raoultella terrigena]MCI1030926.1 adenosylhomocysteinase [Raoultella terrigena]